MLLRKMPKTADMKAAPVMCRCRLVVITPGCNAYAYS